MGDQGDGCLQPTIRSRRKRSSACRDRHRRLRPRDLEADPPLPHDAGRVPPARLLGALALSALRTGHVSAVRQRRHELPQIPQHQTRHRLVWHLDRSHDLAGGAGTAAHRSRLRTGQGHNVQGVHGVPLARGELHLPAPCDGGQPAQCPTDRRVGGLAHVPDGLSRRGTGAPAPSSVPQGSVRGGG